MKSIFQFLFELELLLKFPKRQALAIGIFASLLFALACLPLLFEPKPVAYNETEKREFKQEINAFYAQLTNDSTQRRIKKSQNTKLAWIAKYDSLSLFAFDPNVATEQEFERLGLSNKLAKTIVHYRQRGGKFRKKSDFKKMYGLVEEQFSYLEPYIVFGRKGGVITVSSQELVPGKSIVSFFDFDPNTIDKQGLLRLGFSTKQAQSILNFRISGVVFRKPSDFKKCYAVSDSLFARLAPFIKIKDLVAIPKPSATLIELNSADLDALVSVKGIGTYSAEQILMYRERLGGFRAVEQLLEIKKLHLADSSNILTHFSADETAIKLISINKATLQQLKRHPYIGYAIAKAIVERRETVGLFTEILELRAEKLMTQKQFMQITPYVFLE